MSSKEFYQANQSNAAVPHTFAQGGDTSALSSVQKACRILKVIASIADPRLTVIARAAHLDKATVLRLLDMLVEEGFVVRDSASKQFTLGSELCALGAAAAARFDFRTIAQPSMLRLAAEFEDTVHLFVPSGHESLCVAMELGTFPLRANYLGVGGRRPLGVSAASMAILAALPLPEYDAVIPTIGRLLGTYPKLSVELLGRMAEEVRRRGYAESINLLVDRVGSIGMAVRDVQGRPVCALGISALSDRITERRDALVAALHRETDICRAAWIEASGEPTRWALASAH